MSKRYGRQQKRKAKAEIERLTIIANTANKQASTACAIVDIARRINPNSTVFHPNSIRNHYDRHPLYDYCASPYLSEDAPVEPVHIRYVDLYKLESTLINSNFDRAVHFRSTIRNNRESIADSGYSLSIEAMEHMPIEQIAYELAKSLKSQVR